MGFLSELSLSELSIVFVGSLILISAVSVDIAFGYMQILKIPIDLPTLTNSRGVIVDSDGNMYVTNEHSLKKLTPDGNLIFEIGGKGAEDGQFFRPHGVVFDNFGNIYVADSINDRVQKFNSAGVFQSQIGSSGSGDGGFDRPTGLAFDSSDNLIVADTDNHRLQKFNSEGMFQGWMGRCTSGINCDVGNQHSNGFSCTEDTCSGPSASNGEGKFSSPRDIAFDSLNNMYVLDLDRVQKFDSDGNSILQFGSSCVFPPFGNGCFDPDNGGPLEGGDGQFFVPEGIAIDSSDNLYVADTNNSRIQKFNSTGAFQSKFSGDINLGFLPSGIAFDNDDNIYAAGFHNIFKFNPSGVSVSEFGSFGHQDDHLVAANGVASFGENIYVNDQFFTKKFDHNGVFESKFNGDSFENGQVSNAPDVEFDSNGNIYLTGGSFISKFNPNEVFQGWLGGCEDGVGCDAINFHSNGFSCNSITCSGPDSGSGDGQFRNAMDMAFDTSGNFYVADTQNHRIQKFNSAGIFQGWLGKCQSGTNCDVTNQHSIGFSCNAVTCSISSKGTGEVQFDRPQGIALDSNNNLYVADYFNSRIQKFNSSGIFQTQWGTTGVDDGEFITPARVAGDRSDNIYVTDGQFPRIQKFDSTGQFLSKFGISGSNDNQFALGLTGITLDSRDNIYVADSGNFRVLVFIQECIVPQSGDWIISSSCTLVNSAIAPADVILQNNAILTIPNEISLNIDFTQHKLLVKKGSGVWISFGGKIT